MYEPEVTRGGPCGARLLAFGLQAGVASGFVIATALAAVS
jgi:hypothetical protein